MLASAHTEQANSLHISSHAVRVDDEGGGGRGGGGGGPGVVLTCSRQLRKYFFKSTSVVRCRRISWAV